MLHLPLALPASNCSRPEMFGMRSAEELQQMFGSYSIEPAARQDDEHVMGDDGFLRWEATERTLRIRLKLGKRRSSSGFTYFERQEDAAFLAVGTNVAPTPRRRA